MNLGEENQALKESGRGKPSTEKTTGLEFLLTLRFFYFLVSIFPIFLKYFPQVLAFAKAH